PRLTQRRPVTYVHTAIAASSVRPYMWTVNGPSSSVPELGEGIDARRLTAGAFCQGTGTGRRHSPADGRGDSHGHGGQAPTAPDPGPAPRAQLPECRVVLLESGKPIPARISGAFVN